MWTGFQESSICENISVRGGAAGYVLSRQLCKDINENIVETGVRFVHAVTAGSSVNLPRNNAIYNISESIKYILS